MKKKSNKTEIVIEYTCFKIFKTAGLNFSEMLL